MAQSLRNSGMESVLQYTLGGCLSGREDED